MRTNFRDNWSYLDIDNVFDGTLNQISEFCSNAGIFLHNSLGATSLEEEGTFNSNTDNGSVLEEFLTFHCHKNRRDYYFCDKEASSMKTYDTAPSEDEFELISVKSLDLRSENGKKVEAVFFDLDVTPSTEFFVKNQDSTINSEYVSCIKNDCIRRPKRNRKQKLKAMKHDDITFYEYPEKYPAKLESDKQVALEMESCP